MSTTTIPLATGDFPTSTLERYQVDYMRADVRALLGYYSLIRDCLGGEAVIKGGVDLSSTLGIFNEPVGSIEYGRSGSYNGGDGAWSAWAARRYLPMPNAEDQSLSNRERYRAYLIRAVFYNVTGNTLAGVLGLAFRQDPVIEIPDALNVIKLDADGTGVDLVQHAQEAYTLAFAFGRCGLFVDFPPTEGVTSKKDIDEGVVRPILRLYRPESIHNWQTERRGAKTVLTLVVVHETDSTLSPGAFGAQAVEQYREIRLTDRVEVRVWRRENGAGNWIAGPTTVLRDGNGQPLADMPFTFIGAVTNEPKPAKPPLYDIANLNVHHYMVSADYYEGCYMVGQPTLTLAGLTQEWVTDVLKGTVMLGSRGAVLLPAGGSGELLQPEATNVNSEALQKLESQMQALGAKLITPPTAQKTATETVIDADAENSVVGTIANNVSAAFQWALEYCAVYLAVPQNGIKFELNTEYDFGGESSADRTQLTKEWTGNQITWGEMRAQLRKAGVATEDDETARLTIEKEMQTMLQFATPEVDPLTGAPTGGLMPKTATTQSKPSTGQNEL